MPGKPGKPSLAYEKKLGRWRLRFTHERIRHDFKNSTIPGNDIARANQWMSERLGYVYSGQWKADAVEGSDPTALLADVAARFLEEKAGGDITERTADLYKTHLKSRLIPRFKRLSDITRGSLASYQSERLKQVQLETVKKELSTLRQVLKFAEVQGLIVELPRFPSKPGKSLGTKHQNAPSGFTDGFNADLARRLIEHLPAMSRAERKTGERWPLRDYFLVMAETGLRPGFWDRFRLGVHWRPGQSYLKITPDVDKIRWGRKVPITPLARECLERCAAQARPDGQVFRAKDYRSPLRAAARKAGVPEHVAAKVHAYDMRHARTTELVNRSGGKTLGVGFLVGHKQATTTNRYSHADQKQAEEVLADLGGDVGPQGGPITSTRPIGLCRPSTKPHVSSCAKERTRTSTGVTPLAPQRGDFPRNRYEIPDAHGNSFQPVASRGGHPGPWPQFKGLIKAAYRLGVMPGQRLGLSACGGVS